MTASGHLADELRRIGRQAGLDAVGICDARPFTEARAAIEDRIERGWSAGMQFTYRNPSRSTDPQWSIPGAQAIYVGVRSYARAAPAPAPATNGDGSSGPPARVARYSWVDHYRPLREALEQVAARLREEDWRAQVVADDNALVDRAAAVRAGIGWYGKNTNVLLPDAGSWFVIGSVLTDAPIAPSERPIPVADGCGGCRRCLTGCPTGAIVAPGQLDARRCLAWLLQAPGVFPREHRRALGDRIYGCDDCQEVCPVNVRAERQHPHPDPETEARPTLPVLDLLAASDSELIDLVGRWYIPGRELRYVRRNALIVLGNVGDGADPSTEAALRQALADPDPIVRAHAVWAAGALERLDLIEPVVDDTDPMVVTEVASIAGVATA